MTLVKENKGIGGKGRVNSPVKLLRGKPPK